MIQKITLSVALLLVIAAAFVAGRWMLADLAVIEARPVLEQWADERFIESDEAWREGHSLLERAVALRPYDAEYHRLLGISYELRRFVGGDDGLLSRQNLEAARDAYRRSVSLRPGWSGTWLQLASIKADLYQLDEEFDAAFLAALRFGPHEGDIQLGVSRLALQTWTYLMTRDELMDAALENFQRGLSGNARNTRNLLNLLRLYDVLEPVCDLIDVDAVSALAQRECKGS